MKTISVFILLIYWSIMISAPVMSSDFKLSRGKSNIFELPKKKLRN